MPPDPNWKPDDAPPEGNRFVQKLGTYLLGVAIGLAFLGWIQYRKHLASNAQAPTPVEAVHSPGAPNP